MKFSSKLFYWYQKNKRDLPWRETKNPYKIWISEVILQQTRVNQGLPYYIKFLEKYPSLNELSLASEEEVLLLWQGLGYYRRAINLLESAKKIAKTKNGVFPNTFNDRHSEKLSWRKIFSRLSNGFYFKTLSCNCTLPPTGN